MKKHVTRMTVLFLAFGMCAGLLPATAEEAKALEAAGLLEISSMAEAQEADVSNIVLYGEAKEDVQIPAAESVKEEMQASAVGVVEATEGTQQAANGEYASNTDTQASSIATGDVQDPATGTDAAIKAGQTPAGEADTASGNVQTPAGGADAVSGNVQAPAGEADTASGDAQAPAVGADTASGNVQTPAIETNAREDGQAPAAGDDTAMADDAAYHESARDTDTASDTANDAASDTASGTTNDTSNDTANAQDAVTDNADADDTASESTEHPENAEAKDSKTNEEDAELEMLGENDIASGTIGDNLTWVVDDQWTLTISGTGDMANFSDVTSTPWSEQHYRIESVVIEEGVTSVGSNAFNDCINLRTVQFPATLKTIGGFAFYGCGNLKNFQLPAGLTRIEWYAFTNCRSITSISIPDGMTSISDYAFCGCTSLTDVQLPDTLTTIGGQCFSHCSSLKKITLPASVNTICEGAFFQCTQLEEVNIPEGVTRIDYRTFYNCRKLQTIQLPSTVTYIDFYAFVDCIRLNDIVIPDGVTYIGGMAFSGCVGLTHIEIPESLSTLYGTTFLECTHLQRVTIPASLKEIYLDAFNGCDSLTDIYYEGSKAGWESILKVDPNVEATTTATIHYAICEHVLESVAAKAATLTGEGNIAHYRCKECGKLFQDAQGKTEVTQASVTIPQLINISTVSVSGIATKTYTAEAITQSITLQNGTVTLKEGTDYTVAYSNNINAGTATVTITGKGAYAGSVSKTFTIEAKKVTPAVTLSATSFTYNGKVKKPSVTVKAGAVSLTKDDYTVTYAKGRKTPGTYTVKVTLKGNYQGTRIVSFKIIPKSTTVSKVTGANKSFTVKWKKQATQTTGYQIQYSTSKTFASGNETLTISRPGTTSKKISSLKAKKTYYVRIRTCKKVNGKTYYSAWSKAKTVKTR